MALRIVVEGQGTIETALNWNSTARLNASGSYSFSMPASDPAAAWLVPPVRVFCYWDSTQVGAGVVEGLDISGDVLNVSGGDLARDLLYKPVRYENAGNAKTVAAALAALLPAGWTYVDAITGTGPIVTLNVLWDSLQNAIAALCEMAGFWWHIAGTTLTIANGYGATVAGITPLEVTKSTDASNMVGIVYPFGAGDGIAALPLRAADVTLTAPYTYITETIGGQEVRGVARTDAIGYPATARRRRLDFKGISPPTNSAQGIVYASNTLAQAAVAHLKTNGTPIVEYACEGVWPGVVRPLDRVALTVNNGTLKVSETLVATEVATDVTPERLATVRLRLEANARRIIDDAQVVSDGITATRISPHYPQLRPFDDTITDTTRVSEQGNGGWVYGTIEYKWPPNTTQVFSVQATHKIVPIVEDDGGTNVNGGPPTALEWRLNGTGLFNALPATLNLFSTLIDPVTMHPYAPSFFIQVRGVLRPELMAPAGTPIASIPVIPSGTAVRLQWRENFPPSSGGLNYSSCRLHESAGGAVINDIPVWSWVTITGTYTIYPPQASESVTNMWYPCTYRGRNGYVILYRLTTSGLVGSNVPLFVTDDFAADVQMTIQSRLVSQAK